MNNIIITSNQASTDGMIESGIWLLEVFYLFFKITVLFPCNSYKCSLSPCRSGLTWWTILLKATIELGVVAIKLSRLLSLCMLSISFLFCLWEVKFLLWWVVARAEFWIVRNWSCWDESIFFTGINCPPVTYPPNYSFLRSFYVFGNY